ncbi:MAG TPA: hypothetical protein VM369_07090, partial [Candidatus Binatia bacterium]|nr:hypothetical protein [Candidatus Binatia bacterium]
PEAGGAGPWWIMGVAGMEEGSSEGKTSVSGFFPDFVSDFTQTLPYCFECESGLSSTVAGTSFATPRSAGVASRVLLEARRRLHDSGSIREVLGKPVLASDGTRTISNWQVRRALEEAAYVETLDQYDPINAIFDLGALPPVDEAPWLTVGWGDLSAKSEKGVVQEALAQLGFGTPTRHKTGGFCEYQTAIYKRRWVYWNNPAMAAFNGYTPPAHDPYIYCESALAPVNELPVVGSSPEPAAQDPDTLSCPAAGSETQLASYAGTAPTGLPFVRTSTQTYKVEVSGCTFTKLRFELRWDNANYDLDMKVTGPGYDSGAEAASSADPEVTSKTNPSSGTYTIAVSSYLNVDTPYTVKVFGTR